SVCPALSECRQSHDRITVRKEKRKSAIYLMHRSRKTFGSQTPGKPVVAVISEILCAESAREPWHSMIESDAFGSGEKHRAWILMKEEWVADGPALRVLSL